MQKAAVLLKDIVIYSVTFIRGSPRAVEISAMDFSVRVGKPEVHRDMAASDRPHLSGKVLLRHVLLFEDGIKAGNDIGRHLLIEPFLPVSHSKRDVFCI